MRIIAGQYKGHKLYAPRGKTVRPTLDRVREFIFSFLGDEVQDAVVLDLFAGSGSLGLEAMSRGAKEVSFVDRSAAAIQCIKRNLEKISASAHVYRMPVQVFLKFAQEQKLSYDLIFCDPPYAYDRLSELAQEIKSRQILKDRGLFIYESSSRISLPIVQGFHIIKQKEMGDTVITFFSLSHE